MSRIKYNFAAIEGAAGDIKSTSGRINGLLQDLKGDIQPMTATWEGDSATAYIAAQQKWDNAAAELNTVLATISTTLSDSNSAMSRINTQAMNSWG
ncbi:WXG100 family type VII secretion target [Corynebacterium endometrii]|uniref:ESAT-6-like protein n=1 Tax=Corynebacterium endometrii TaxID=2488819 RepID=A0A4P7QDV7_9CORY|nr:WXG100 family type VII secretion target [Corynebacterium endometrii]QCB27735.1 6 kDa early secretory antigenic target [Corynebacterium endometrii]